MSSHYWDPVTDFSTLNSCKDFGWCYWTENSNLFEYAKILFTFKPCSTQITRQWFTLLVKTSAGAKLTKSSEHHLWECCGTRVWNLRTTWLKFKATWEILGESSVTALQGAHIHQVTAVLCVHKLVVSMENAIEKSFHLK